jgi:hypothetical protein
VTFVASLLAAAERYLKRPLKSEMDHSDVFQPNIRHRTQPGDRLSQESLIHNDVEPLKQVKLNTRIPLASGEHELTRWGARRQVGRELAQSLAELAARARRIAALAVVETHRDMNQGLQEQPPRTASRSPCFLQHFVTLEEFAMVEEVDSLPQERVHLYS